MLCQHFENIVKHRSINSEKHCYVKKSKYANKHKRIETTENNQCSKYWNFLPHFSLH
jgi:hypothetical protein